MTIILDPEAEEEFVQAVAYYEDCEPGLGLDFSREVYVALHNAAAYPTMWPTVEEEVRRCRVHRFPYGVLYGAEADGIFVLAVMHLHRKPDYWRHRLGSAR